MNDDSIHNNFDQLYINYQPRLIAYAQRFVKDPAEVQDLVADCFMSLWNKHSSLDSDQATMLLFVMTRNRCLNYLKHKKITKKYLENCYNETKYGEERLYNYNFSFSEAEHPYLYQELEQQIHSIISSLPERCREVFVLSRFDGLKNREIAEHLNISLNSVEKHIHRALRVFTNVLNQEESASVKTLIILWLMNI